MECDHLSYCPVADELISSFNACIMFIPKDRSRIAGIIYVAVLSAQGRRVTSRVSSTCANDRLQITKNSRFHNKKTSEISFNQVKFSIISCQLSGFFLWFNEIYSSCQLQQVLFYFIFWLFLLFCISFFFANCSYQNQVNALLALFVDQFEIACRFGRRDASTI